MSCLIKTLSYNFKTGETTLSERIDNSANCRADDTLIRFFAEKCLEDFQSKKKNIQTHDNSAGAG